MRGQANRLAQPWAHVGPETLGKVRPLVSRFQLLQGVDFPYLWEIIQSEQGSYPEVKQRNCGLCRAHVAEVDERS